MMRFGSVCDDAASEQNRVYRSHARAARYGAFTPARRRLIDEIAVQLGAAKLGRVPRNRRHRPSSPGSILQETFSQCIPPFLILHVAGRPDSRQRSQEFAAALKKAGVSAEVAPGEGKTHGTINTELGELGEPGEPGEPGDKPTAALLAFLRSCFEM
jgi:acetyl esterase/lipase